ncbi:hypothetical protein EJ05DRAFT_485191 [Pseudovirgaria hyperparasitica]|uniref:Uncharacterized protein n=1 Tax=Pseudovirgaria hyperparasitica TaxID=470096 RepID=A0A6A6W8E6_9PEZI|nr:uncharacterized protein EJ05DRAFT_485191 [Pseudovirgaria hyperparasitica]KAF2759122.1 hypothetical protein EJ05DRAFT_485191 [Pseudovirgaria hyperparasitica]
MLASFPENANRLRRSKSVSTVNPNQRSNIPDHVNPWVAQQQALLAATTAYERAHAGVTPTRLTTTTASTALPRTMSNISRRSEGSHLAKRGSTLRYSLEEHPRAHLARRNTVQSSTSNGNLMSGGLPPQIMSHVPSASGPNLRGKMSLTSLATPTRSIASEPVRTGLRKARSMFYASSRQTTDNNEDTCSMTLIDPTLANDTPQKLTALPPFPSHSVIPVQSRPYSATQRYQLDGARSAGRDRSSGIFTPFKKLQSISSRKSSRTEAGSVSFNSVRSTATTPGQEIVQSQPLQHKKSRSLSGNFKDKIMKVFRRTPTITQQEMPAQQVGASRNYYYNSKTTDDTSNVLGDGSRSSRSSLHPSRPGTPPVPRDPSFPHLAMRQGSGSSEGTSSSRSKSRVTSWTDSTAGHAALNDPKRLSIIHEVSRPSIAMPVPTRPTTLLARSVLESELEDDSSSYKRPYPVEPRRVYSALMKEMARKEIEVLEVSKLEFDKDGNPVTSALDSLPSQQHRRSMESGRNEANRMTIRTVSPDEPVSLSRASSVRGRISVPPFDLTDVREESSGDEFPTKPADGCSLYAQSHRNSSSVGRLQRSQRANPPSAEQRAARAERASHRWKSPLDDGHRSLERASNEKVLMASSNSFLDRGQEPTEDCRAVSIDGDGDDFGTPKATHVTYDDSIADGIVLPKSRTPARCVSPSIYSQHTNSQHSFVNMDSVTNLPYAVPKEGAGSAVIITSHPVSCWTIGTPTPTGKRVSHSARSSRDWKAWLSKEVAELEQLASAELAINELDLKQQGHRRERTQISEDDEQSVTSVAPSCMPRLARPRLESRPGSRISSRMNDRFPMIETSRRGSSQSVATLRSVRKKSPSAVTPESISASTTELTKENAPVKRSVSPFPRISRLAARSPRSVGGCMSSGHDTQSATAIPNTPVTPATPSPARARKLGRRISKAKSALEMHAQYSSPDLLRNKMIRKQAGCSPQFEGDTLRMIIEGPYQHAKTPSPLKRVENSPMVSKFSEIGLDDTASVRSHGSSATPGHRLADMFLRQRKSGEVIDDDSVAFL